MEDPILLDATMVRCVANRDSVNYDPECVNAREAVERLASAEEQARRAALEAESERKREALRRTREATDALRRQAEELERQRAQAEYLGLLPEPQTAPDETAPAPVEAADDQGTPLVTVSDAQATGSGSVQDERDERDERDETIGMGEPPAATVPVTTDLGEIRKALEERAPPPAEPPSAEPPPAEQPPQNPAGPPG